MSSISVVMGSQSDWPTVKEACLILEQFGVDYEKHVISAHRMPTEMFAFAQAAVEKGTKVIIACAGGAAHLPGMIAANTPPARDRGAGPNQGVGRHGLALVDCADASRDSGRYDGDWGGGRQERRFISPANSRDD